MSFNSFQKTILDFQLKSHENFLRTFLILFKQIDRDNNGIIDEVKKLMGNNCFHILFRRNLEN